MRRGSLVLVLVALGRLALRPHRVTGLADLGIIIRDRVGQVGLLDLTPAHADARAPLPDGVEMIAFAERPDLERAIYDLDILVQPEIPTMALEPTPSFEAWREQTSGDPGFLRELSVMAVRDERMLGSIPRMNNHRQRLTAIEGQPPDLAALPPGCAFNPRCPSAFDRCREAVPAETALGDGQHVRCWLASCGSSSIEAKLAKNGLTESPPGGAV